MSEEIENLQATTDYLPKIDSLMIAEFFSENDCFCASEIREVREMISEQESYGDSPIGYIEVQRINNVCTVRCKICPEHCVRKKIALSLIVDEELEKILSVTCLDCNGGLGGCKHGVAFLMWVYNRSEEPAPPTIECYWRRTQLATDAALPKFITTKDFGAVEAPSQVVDGEAFLREMIQALKDNKIDSPLLKYFS